MEKKVKLVLIASGGGTDANSIMEAWRNNGIPEVSGIILISTKKEAGCLDKAEHHEVPHIVVDYSDNKDVMSYNLAMRNLLLQQYDVDLVFLVGCLKKILPLSSYYQMYNIHPADPARHGGDKDPKKVVEELQKHILPYEWLMLPLAVRIAARRIMERRMK